MKDKNKYQKREKQNEDGTKTKEEGRKAERNRKGIKCTLKKNYVSINC